MNLYVIVQIILLLLFAGPACATPKYEQMRDRGILVLYPAAYKEQARISLKMLLDSREEIAARLQLPKETPVSAELVGDNSLFNEMVGNSSHLRILGVAYSPDGRIVINLARLTMGGESNLYETLAHETAHVMLGQLEKEKQLRLSRWFHEGVACWLGRVLPDSPDDHRLETAAIMNALIPFYTLEKGFPPFQEQSQLAYLQSEDFIRFILKRHGQDSIARVLRALENGESLDQGFMRALGIDVFEEEAVWANSLKGGHPFLKLVYNNFTILTVGALLTVVAFVCYRMKRRRILHRFDRDEQLAVEINIEESADEN
ncbi:MAG: peptidase MA family metallohydrolase [Planctomycetota bacterium]|nr:peptidase MA family metallohydrolase [Planctomycetota bacterium]